MKKMIWTALMASSLIVSYKTLNAEMMPMPTPSPVDTTEPPTINMTAAPNDCDCAEMTPPELQTPVGSVLANLLAPTMVPSDDTSIPPPRPAISPCARWFNFDILVKFPADVANNLDPATIKLFITINGTVRRNGTAIAKVPDPDTFNGFAYVYTYSLGKQYDLYFAQGRNIPVIVKATGETVSFGVVRKYEGIYSETFNMNSPNVDKVITVVNHPLTMVKQ